MRVSSYRYDWIYALGWMWWEREKHIGTQEHFCCRAAYSNPLRIVARSDISYNSPVVNTEHAFVTTPRRCSVRLLCCANHCEGYACLFVMEIFSVLPFLVMWIGGLLSTLSLPIKCLFLEESLCLLRERYTLNFRKKPFGYVSEDT
jgi:hypothetical protein